MPNGQQLYYVNTGNGPTGPFTLATINAMVQNGQLTADVRVCPPGGQNWMPLASPSNEPKSDERSVASVGDSQAARLYYVQQGREAKGPYRFEVLQDMAAEGLVTAKTYVWHEGATRWVPYEQILQQGNGAVVVANSATDARQQGDGAGAVASSATDTQQPGSGPSLIEKGLKVKDKVVGTVSKVNSIVVATADLHKLEGFSWKSFFGGVFRKHSDEEVYEIFQCGTPTSTPPIEQISDKWPTPWFFSRFLFFGMALFGTFWYLVFKQGMPTLAPFYCITAALFFPLALYILFYELNIWRNVSMYNAVRCLVVGGILALIFLVLKGKNIDDDKWYFEAPVKEYCKLLSALYIGSMLIKIRMNRILPGMLMGCAVAAGLAIIEGGSIMFVLLMNEDFERIAANAEEQFLGVIGGSLYEFLEVVWCIIIVGAFCKVQALREKEGGQSADKWSKSTMFDRRFIVLVAVPLLMHFAITFLNAHGADNTAFRLTFLGSLLLFAIISWLFVLRLIQNGIDQVREEKESLQHAEPEQTPADAMPEQVS